MKTTYTTILHNKATDLSFNEYALCDIIDKLSRPFSDIRRKKLAELLRISENGLRKMLKRVKDLGYIDEKKEGLQCTLKWKNEVNIEPTQSVGDPHKVEVRPTQSVVSTPTQSVALYNNRSYINNDNSGASPPLKDLRSLPEFLGNSKQARIFKVYSLLWQDLYGIIPKLNFARLGRVFKPLIAEYSEVELACFIILHFFWHGASGDDKFIHKKLADNCFPLEWLPHNINQYKVYLVNTLGITTDEDMRKYVKEHLQGSNSFKKIIK